MAESFVIPIHQNKEEKYLALLPQIEALVSGETDLIANLSNIAAALKFGMGFFWVGFYLVKQAGNTEELVLGPFQGTVACTRIGKGKGVCGSSWQKGEIIVVEDVAKFPGHIACSSESKSEIVLPAKDKNGTIFLVLDVDSDKPSDFDGTDIAHLTTVVKMIENSHTE